MNKQLLKYYFFIIYFSIFLSVIKFYVVLLAFIKVTSIIRYKSIKTKINEFYKKIILIYSFYFIYSILCFIFIFFYFSFSASSILIRFISQQFSLILLFFQIYIGFQIAHRFKPNDINRFYKIIIYVLVFFGVYQFLAFQYGLPYVGLYAYDIDFGLRVSSLCIEPKYFSSVLVISFFYFIELIRNYRSNRTVKFFFLLLIILLLYRSGSGNGYLSFIILFLVNLYVWKPRLILFTSLLVLFLCIWFVSNYELFNLRASHVIIIESIKNRQISFQGWDDLIVLPLMSWIKYPFFLIFGFGFNLNHFFASEFIQQATWLDGNTYINGNISIIDFISNFGFFLPIILFIYLTIKTKKALTREVSRDLKSVIKLAYYTFVVGFFIGGNISIPFFSSVGMLFYYVVYDKDYENITTTNSI